MLNEVKLFFENLIHFRHLLKEGVGESTVVDAIQKHKIVYIYYAGDNTIMKGYRTIKPMVLGYSKSKEAQTSPYMLLRAWEIAGNSDSKKKYTDEKGRYQYGWRLFRVDKITSFLPTGKFFRTDNFSPEMISQYNPNDSQMQNIVTAVELTSGKPQTNKKGSVIAQKIPTPPSAFAGQKEKFQYFSQIGKKQREATADEIEHLWGVAKKIKKKSPQNMLVVTDKNGDMILRDIKDKDKFPPESIVGDLKSLYIDLVKPNEKVDNTFFEKTKKKNLFK